MHPNWPIKNAEDDATEEAGGKSTGGCGSWLPWLLIGLLVAGAICNVRFNRLRQQLIWYRGHLTIISIHFREIKEWAWEVDDSGNPTDPPAEVTSHETWRWRVRREPDEQWTEYAWELYPIDEESLRFLEDRGISVDQWRKTTYELEHGGKGAMAVLLPVTDAALELHLQLGLQLPDSYEIQMLSEAAGDVSSQQDGSNNSPGE